MNETDKCFEKGLLRKIKPDIENAKASLEASQQNINDAKIHLENKLYKWTLIASYTSMFHAARSLLYKDGVKERSHYCICAYIKEKYKNKIEPRYINELNMLREQRHQIFYGDENVKIKEVEEIEAETSVSIATGFLKEIKKIVN